MNASSILYSHLCGLTALSPAENAVLSSFSHNDAQYTSPARSTTYAAIRKTSAQPILDSHGQLAPHYTAVKQMTPRCPLTPPTSKRTQATPQPRQIVRMSPLQSATRPASAPRRRPKPAAQVSPLQSATRPASAPRRRPKPAAQAPAKTAGVPFSFLTREAQKPKRIATIKLEEQLLAARIAEENEAIPSPTARPRPPPQSVVKPKFNAVMCSWDPATRERIENNASRAAVRRAAVERFKRGIESPKPQAMARHVPRYVLDSRWDLIQEAEQARARCALERAESEVRRLATDIPPVVRRLSTKSCVHSGRCASAGPRQIKQKVIAKDVPDFPVLWSQWEAELKAVRAQPTFTEPQPFTASQPRATDELRSRIALNESIRKRNISMGRPAHATGSPPQPRRPATARPPLAGQVVRSTRASELSRAASLSQKAAVDQRRELERLAIEEREARLRDVYNKIRGSLSGPTPCDVARAIEKEAKQRRKAFAKKGADFEQQKKEINERVAARHPPWVVVAGEIAARKVLAEELGKSEVKNEKKGRGLRVFSDSEVNKNKGLPPRSCIKKTCSASKNVEETNSSTPEPKSKQKASLDTDGLDAAVAVAKAAMDGLGASQLSDTLVSPLSAKTESKLGESVNSVTELGETKATYDFDGSVTSPLSASGAETAYDLSLSSTMAQSQLPQPSAVAVATGAAPEASGGGGYSDDEFDA